MILNTKDFSHTCRVILAAIDNKDSSLFSETLELKTEGKVLHLNVTNREYYVTTSFELPNEEVFHASVNARLFLTLISKLTTETIKITKDGNSIKIEANGTYKIPIIYAYKSSNTTSTIRAAGESDNSSMLELPKIEIGNVTNEMTINSDILHSILTYNSKELLRGVIVKPVQGYYYVDEVGAITFTAGACVNNFNLEKPIKMLLDPKVVGLFKLFKPDTPVSFKLGQDMLTEDLIQTKVEFKTDTITIVAKLKDFGLISSVPVTAIRTMANKAYSNSVVLNKDNLLSALTRILLFGENPVGKFIFTNHSLTIFDSSEENSEVINFENDLPIDLNYTMGINLIDFKLIIDSSEDEYITINFGDHKAIVVQKANISDIIMERNY